MTIILSVAASTSHHSCSNNKKCSNTFLQMITSCHGSSYTSICPCSLIYTSNSRCIPFNPFLPLLIVTKSIQLYSSICCSMHNANSRNQGHNRVRYKKDYRPINSKSTRHNNNSNRPRPTKYSNIPYSNPCPIQSPSIHLCW